MAVGRIGYVITHHYPLYLLDLISRTEMYVELVPAVSWTDRDKPR